VNRFEEFCGEDESRVFAMLMALFRIWWQYHRQDKVDMDRMEIMREVEKSLEELAKRRVEWKRHRAHLEEVGRWATSLMDESEDRLDRLLKRARCDPRGAAARAAPAGIFREGDDEKHHTWVQAIMAVCEPGGEMEVRELVTLLQPHHKLSADTIRGNVMSVLSDACIVKRGIVKYIRGISKYVPPCTIQLGGKI